MGCSPVAPAERELTATAWVGRRSVWLVEGGRVGRFSLGADSPSAMLRAMRGDQEPYRKHRRPGASPVVVAGDDRARVLDVVATVGGLMESSAHPVGVRVEPGREPVVVMPVTFEACRAVEPVRYCSAVRFEVFSERIELHRSPQLVGTDCPHGAHALLRALPQGTDGPARPRRPAPTVRPFPRRDPIGRMLHKHGAQIGLEDCPDTVVRFHGFDAAWGGAKAVLADVDRALAARITLDVTEDAPVKGAAGR